MRISTILIIFFSIILIALILLSGFKETRELVCDAPDFDFKQIPIKDGKIISEHIFVIKNNTDKDILIEKISASCTCVEIKMDNRKIPRNGKQHIAVSITLNPTDFFRRSFSIIMLPVDKSIPPVKLTVAGSASFASFSVPREIDFRNIFAETIRAAEVDLYLPNEKSLKNIVREIKFETPDLWNAKVDHKYSIPRESGYGVFYENKATIQINFNVPSKGSVVRNEKMHIEMVNGDTLSIPLTWNLVEQPVFEPNRYLLVNLLPNQKRKFQIIYNENIGGKIKNILLNGTGLKLLKTEQNGNAVFINLEYVSTESPVSGQVGTVEVENEMSETKIMEIVADVFSYDYSKP